MRSSAASVIAGALIAFVLLYAFVEIGEGLGIIVAPGYEAALKSGVITSVVPGSPAAHAGLRAGDRVDFARGGWTLHLSIDRTNVLAGKRYTLPIVRNGRPSDVALFVPQAVPPPDAWVHFVNLAMLLLYASLGGALYFFRRSTTTLIFFALACGEAIQIDNLDPLRIAPPAWMPAAMVLAAAGPAIGQYGLLYFSLVFSNRSSWAAGVRIYALLPIIAGLFGLYYYHFYAYTVAPAPFDTFMLGSILNWSVFALAAIAVTARVSREAETRRLRWVAVGVWAQAIVFALFYIEENSGTPGIHGSNLSTYLFAWFQPAPFCIAYVLMRTRVIDARVIGARTLVYGLLTAIPIASFSVADWFFSRKLADARLATFAEFGIAVLFGIWLNTLHKRIDRFVERIVFASRHHAFQRLRHAMHALASVELSETATEMLCGEAAAALRLASGAVFMQQGNVYDCVAQHGWDGCAGRLEPDDPLVLFARSEHRAVRLAEVAPSKSALPEGNGAPEIAVPIMLQHQMIGVAFYGKHTTGEHLDGDEETLLSELAQAAAAAIERLQSIERVRELEVALGLQLSAR